jgi:hypothetical protein
LSLFVVSVVGSILPIRVIESAWQLAAVSSLVGYASYALLGCFLIYGASLLDPGHEKGKAWLEWIRRASMPVSLGYLALVAVLIQAMVMAGIAGEKPLRKEIQQLRNVREDVLASQDTASLRAAMLKLPGAPRLPENFNRPLPAFQQEVADKLQANANNLEQVLENGQRSRRSAQAIRLLREGGSAVIIALFYAAFGGWLPRRKGRRSWRA